MRAVPGMFKCATAITRPYLAMFAIRTNEAISWIEAAHGRWEFNRIVHTIWPSLTYREVRL